MGQVGQVRHGLSTALVQRSDGIVSGFVIGTASAVRFLVIRPFEKRDILCYGVCRPSVRKLFRFQLIPPTVYIQSS